MANSLLHPGAIGPADTDRILRFLNGVTDVDALAETVGFAEGLGIGRRLGGELLTARPFLTLDQVLAVTGITPARFTDLAMALSAARPAQAPDTLRFLQAETTLWLGQTTTITAQLVTPQGQGQLSRQVTCIASDGVLSAPGAGGVQTGRAVRLSPEPDGILRFGFGPRLTPGLATTERATLAAELSQLDPAAPTPEALQKSLRRLAARYRAQGGRALQIAIDQLYQTYETQATTRTAPWPIEPVTLLAFTHDDAGQVQETATLTLDIRNWLGAFHSALAGEIEADQTLPDALKLLSTDAGAGRDLSRQIVQATQGYTGLERGVLGRKLRQASSARSVNAFLDANTDGLKGQAMVNAVRAAGASKAAIDAGGFAAFEAIRSVQEVGDAIKTPGKTDWLRPRDLDPFGARIASLETSATTRTDLTQFERRITQTLEGRIKTVEETAITRADLADLQTEFNAKLDGFDGGGALDARFEALDERLKGLESGTVRRADLDQLSARFDAKLDEAAQDRVTRDEFKAFSAAVNSQMETTLPRGAVEEMIKEMRVETDAKLRSKANARTITDLRVSLEKVTDRQSVLGRDLNKLETRVGPGRGGLS